MVHTGVHIRYPLEGFQKHQTCRSLSQRSSFDLEHETEANRCGEDFAITIAKREEPQSAKRSHNLALIVSSSRLWYDYGPAGNKKGVEDANSKELHISKRIGPPIPPAHL